MTFLKRPLLKFKNKKVWVLGFGVSGQAATRFFMGEKAQVLIFDQGPKAGLEKTRELFEKKYGSRDCAWHLERNWENEDHAPPDFVCVSPGIDLRTPFFKKMRRLGVPVLGEYGLAAMLLDCPFVAVTGTNGKSTTASLIHHVLGIDGYRSSLAGNIGRPLMEVVLEDKKTDYIVTEVSSYQLESLGFFRPKVSVILNVTPDHMSRYRDHSAYLQAKINIARQQNRHQWCLYPYADLSIRKRLVPFSVTKVPFSLTPLSRRFKTSLFLDEHQNVVFRRGGREEGYCVSGTSLKGWHHRENIMSAIGTARFLGVTPKSVEKAINTFEGLPHRVQHVRVFRGVDYYDDSKATNVDAVLRALEGFPDRKVVLIAGGQDKGSDYRPLRKLIRKKVRWLVLTGQARHIMSRQLEGLCPLRKTGNLHSAVREAAGVAESGDVVLLSPACSSFDEFSNFEARGRCFQEVVRSL